MRNDHDELTPRERERLLELRAHPGPPPAWEDALVRDLGRAGLLRARGRRRRVAPALAAGVLLAFGAGYGLRGLLDAAAPSSWMMLLHSPPETRLDGAELAARVAEYRAWAQDNDARLVGGSRLQDETRILSRDAGGALAVEQGERLTSLGGYFLVAGDDLDAALRLAGDCPHLRHGGWIELRRLGEAGRR